MSTKKTTKKSVVAAASPADMEDWRVQDALSTLLRAREIRKDPKLMAKVKALAKTKLAEMQSVADSKE